MFNPTNLRPRRILGRLLFRFIFVCFLVSTTALLLAEDVFAEFKEQVLEVLKDLISI